MEIESGELNKVPHTGELAPRGYIEVVLNKAPHSGENFPVLQRTYIEQNQKVL